MADEAPKKRTFRKFTFRGVDLDQLLDMSTDELVDLFHARARRKFQRGLKRKPLALIKKLRAAKKSAESGEKPEPVRTHLRNMIIVPEMIGSIVGVYNGKTFNQVHRLGSMDIQSFDCVRYTPARVVNSFLSSRGFSYCACFCRWRSSLTWLVIT